MENICNNYQDIVERAIFAGIIKEEHRDLYLSAIYEENDANSSEIENLLNKKETINQNSRVMQNKNYNSDLFFKSNRGENEEDAWKNMRVSNTMKEYLDDCESLLSSDTIENYSILDFKCAKEKDILNEETDSDTSTKERRKYYEPNRNANIAKTLTEVMKKPRKDQIIDFDVPIYIDVRKKKCLIKPHIKDFMRPTKYDVSKTCDYTNPSVRILGCQRSQMNNKCNLLKDTASTVKVEKNHHGSKSENINKPNACLSLLSPLAAISTETPQETNFMKQKSVHTCSGEKKSSESHKVTPAMIPKYEKDESNIPSCYSHKHNISSVRRFKAHKDAANQKIPKNCLNNAKNATKVPPRIHKITNKDKYFDNVSASGTVQNTLNDSNAAETSSETRLPLHGSPSKRNFRGNHCDRFLNVNIICQFCSEEEKETADDSQDLNSATHTQNQERNMKSEGVAQPPADTKKNKEVKKLQLLSKLFTNMKINRKQKKPEPKLQ